MGWIITKDKINADLIDEEREVGRYKGTIGGPGPARGLSTPLC